MQEKEQGKDLHSREKNESAGDEAAKANSGQWYSVLALAELMLI